MMNRNFLLSVGMLAGTIIGAGIFSLPYVVSRIGLARGGFYLCVFGAVYFAVHRMYAALIEQQKGGHQFAYLARTYLPRGIGAFASYAVLGEMIFVLVAYLILAPTFLGLIFGATHTAALIGFWVVGSLFMLARLSWLGWAESMDTICVLAVAGIIFLSGSTAPAASASLPPFSAALFFLPFGPLLFSLSGRPAIPKVVEEWKKNEQEGKKFSLTKAIAWGTAIPVLLYGIFVVSVLKINPSIPPEALNGLAMLPPALLILLGVLGVITLWTSYFMIGIDIKNILWKDFGARRWLSILVVWGVPFLLYLAGIRNFLAVISFTGSIFLGLEGIFVVWMWRRAFPAHAWGWAAWPLAGVFCTAIGYEAVRFFL